MVVDLDPQPKVSTKQMLLRKGNPGQKEGYAKVDSVEDLEFLERNIKKSMKMRNMSYEHEYVKNVKTETYVLKCPYHMHGVGLRKEEAMRQFNYDYMVVISNYVGVTNGILAIGFSKHIHQILFKDIETTLVLKLLGRNIGLSGLPSFMYKKRILEAVGRLVGKVVKLDFNSDSKSKGRFSRMTVFLDPDKHLVSQVLVNGELVWVEYEALLTICFSCGQYDHLKEMCTSPAIEKSFEIREASDNSESSNQASDGESLTFGPWMVVESKIWRGQRDKRNQREGDLEKARLGSRYSTLNGMDNMEKTISSRKVLVSVDSNAKLKGKEKIVARIIEKEKVDLKLGDDGLSVGIVEVVDSGSLEYKIGADGLGKQVNGGLGQNLFGGGPSGSKNSAGHATNLNQGI
ncbi:hypothetical protein Godav_021106 [Gossypium davidsonii]|uniref:CCHC-type domain-containing protein n=1 Tax=Gossypium davidsonii TaxID=34287 RepID=A0A7J8R5B1_GOSDV|nr:hypothetical protein [Gossypium davidsonii]